MSVYWSPMPGRTVARSRTMRRKSSKPTVMPMLSMMSPSPSGISGPLNQVKNTGRQRASALGEDEPEREGVGGGGEQAQRRGLYAGAAHTGCPPGGTERLMGFQADLLKGKAALVTGGGSGICRGLALALAAHGCDVAVTGRRTEPLETVRGEIEALGVLGFASAGDVRDPAAAGATVASTVEAFGRLDILVNGAAGNFLCLAEDLSPNGFGAVIDIDLKGTFHMCRAALPHLKAQQGSVLNISATLHYLGTAAQLHVVGGEGGCRCADAGARGGVGSLRDSRERDRSGTDRRDRGCEAPAGGRGEDSDRQHHAAAAAGRDR